MSKSIEKYLKKPKPTVLVQANIDQKIVEEVWDILVEEKIKMKDLITASLLAYIEQKRPKKK